MTESNDLVERLREHAEFYDQYRLPPAYGTGAVLGDLFRQAADRIETLEIQWGQWVQPIETRAEAAEARVKELEESVRLANAVALGKRLKVAVAEAKKYQRALKAICAVDYETNEALQSTCIDLARHALADEPKGEM